MFHHTISAQSALAGRAVSRRPPVIAARPTKADGPLGDDLAEASQYPQGRA